tara:strand:- start:861 stop:1280 length:420 start_codon:yes stop_codon:yes gene_type:complete
VNHEEIVAHIRSFDTDALREALQEAPEPPTGESKADIIADTIVWLETLQGDLISLVNQVGGGEDVEMVVAIQYVELKSRWIAFNTKMNYSMFRGNHPHVSDMCRATAVSTFLQHVEGLLREDDIDHITEFLARPMKDAA